VSEQERAPRLPGLRLEDAAQLMGAADRVVERPAVAREAGRRHRIASGQERGAQLGVAVLSGRGRHWQVGLDDAVGVQHEVAIPDGRYVDLIDGPRPNRTGEVSLGRSWRSDRECEAEDQLEDKEM
jgi:hypothetical protein